VKRTMPAKTIREQKAYRKPKPNPMETRPTFDRFPEEILFPMNIYRLK